VYATAPVALCVINRDGRLLAVNERHSILADRPISHLIGVKVAELHEEGGQNIIRDFRVLDAGGAVPEHELYIRGKTYLVSVAPIRDALGKVIAISVAHTDVTERRRLDEELAKANKLLEELAVRDHLTSLFNRRHFDKTLVDEIGRLHQEGSMLSVLLIDVDFFKRYNDQYGHIMGDQCLADIAYAIKAALHRSGDTAFRYGGEEFAIVLSNTDANGARAVAERIRIAIAALNRRHGASPLGVVTVSIGIGTVIGPYNSDMPLTRELLLRAVDTALYAAKANGRNTVIAGTVLQKNVGDG
jgi:diguanylate cyclase (GGDEF)-like protein